MLHTQTDRQRWKHITLERSLTFTHVLILFDTLHFSLQIRVFFWFPFCSFWKANVSFSCSVGLLEMNSPKFSVWKWLYFIFEVYLKYIFTGYGIWQCYSFSILKRFYFLLASIDSTQESPVIYIFSLKFMSSVPLWLLFRFHLLLLFNSLARFI